MFETINNTKKNDDVETNFLWSLGIIWVFLEFYVFKKIYAYLIIDTHKNFM